MYRESNYRQQSVRWDVRALILVVSVFIALLSAKIINHLVDLAVNPNHVQSPR